MPHVLVAKRMILNGTNLLEIVNHRIKFLICTSAESKNFSFAERAYSPYEFNESNGKLRVDYTWYIDQQIMPPLMRLVQNINEIDVSQIADWLGSDPSKYHAIAKRNDHEGTYFTNMTESELDVSKQIEYNCIYCKEHNDIKHIYDRVRASCMGIYCSKCYKRMPLGFIVNKVALYVKGAIKENHGRSLKCDDCTIDFPLGVPLSKCPQCDRKRTIQMVKDTHTACNLVYAYKMFKVLKDNKDFDAYLVIENEMVIY